MTAIEKFAQINFHLFRKTLLKHNFCQILWSGWPLGLSKKLSNVSRKFPKSDKQVFTRKQKYYFWTATWTNNFVVTGFWKISQ